MATTTTLDHEDHSHAEPADVGDGGNRVDTHAPVAITVPRGAPDPLAALEAQRAGRTYAQFWRALLLHNPDLTSAYQYINDKARTDLPQETAARATTAALGLVDSMELWAPGKPKPVLPDFRGVSSELLKRPPPQKVSHLDVKASNAAVSTRSPDVIEALVVYVPHFANGAAPNPVRLTILLKLDGESFGVTDAFFF